MPENDLETAPSGKPSLFPETRWSIVIQAQSGDASLTQRALEELCQAYWYPLYAFARSRGLSPHDAEDRTQAFFQHLLAHRSFELVSSERGRLRAFLLAAMKNFLTSKHREEQAVKRGGGVPLLSIDRDWAEGSLDGEAGSEPEVLFDRHWAHALLREVSHRLEEYYETRGKRKVYEAIKGCLEGDGTYAASDELGKRLGLSPEGVRSAVFKLRTRFRDYVEESIADTCASPEDRQEEIVHLCRILAR